MGIFDNNPSPEQIAKAQERLTSLPIEIRGSKIFILTIIIGLGFLIIGIMMGLDGQKEGYLIGGFFSLAAFFGIWVLSPNGPVLKIDKDGFEYKSIFKSEKIKWSDVKSFGLWQSRGNKMLTWVWIDRIIESGERKKGFGSSLMGFQASFQNYYAIGQKDLLALMVLMHEKYGNK